jgi:hypothetical protein
MTTAPEPNSPDEQDPSAPVWLGSVVRREGTQTSGDGWVEPEQVEKPRWLGSVARRGDHGEATERTDSGGEPVHSLYLVDMDGESESTGEEPAEQSSGDWDGSSARARLDDERESEPEEVIELFEPGDELDGRRKTRYVVGELGMRLRVVA